MLRRLRDQLRRTPAAVRLVAIAALLLVAVGAHLGTLSRGSDLRWLLALVVGVALALVSGAPRHRWPLPAIWLVATLLAASRDDGLVAFAVAALVSGTVALVVAVAADLVTARRHRARSRT